MKKIIRGIKPLVAKINDLETDLEKLSSDELKAKTWRF